MDNLSLYYDMIVKKGDRIVKKYRKRKCHSFVKQFLDFLFLFLSSSTCTIKNTGGTDSDFLKPTAFTSTFDHTTFLIYNTNTTVGPAVGGGLTGVSINDYKIEAATVGGNLQYSIPVAGAPTTTAAGSTWISTKIFTNNSGFSVTVNEIGIYTYHYRIDVYFLLARDNLTSPVILANGESLTLNYTFQTTI